jgi:hypothetical protein
MQAPPPATSGYYFKLTLSIATGTMTAGDSIHFGVDRDEAMPSGQMARSAATVPTCSATAF